MTATSTRRLGLLLVACSTLFAAGCDSGATDPHAGPETGTPAVLQLSPEATELVVGNQAELSVTAADKNGLRVPGTDLTLSWSSSDPSIATVDDAGKVTARAAGAATIIAQLGKVKASAVIQAIAPTIKTLKLAPRDARLAALGDTVRLKADVVWNGQGKPALKWTSVDPAVASIDTDGLVTAIGTGTARIVVNAGNLADTARVVVQQVPASLVVAPAATTVNALGDTLRLSAQVLDANGRAISGVTFSWASLSPKVATVDPMGVLISRGIGLALVTVAAAGHVDTASINVRQVPATLTVAPAALSVTTGQTGKLVASAADANGVAIPGASFTWSSSNAAVTTVSGAGEVKGASQGSATVTASFAGLQAGAAVSVSAIPVNAISVSPSPVSLPTGASLSLQARTTDAAGNALSGRAVAWSSANARVATVEADGLVRAVAAGSTTITASAEGKSAKISVTVSAPAAEVKKVASVSINPGSASVNVGASITLVALPKDDAGNALSERAISWASSAPAIATVTAEGVVTARAAGKATITASSEGQSGTATLTVTATAPAAAPVASVTISPDSVALSTASTVSLSAFVKDDAGTALTDRTVAWSSSKPAVATISKDGVVTAVAAGSAVISATSEGKTGSAKVVVTPPAPAPVATVTLSPTTLALDPGATQAISAFIKDAAGNLLAGRELAWTSSNSAVARVGSDGKVTAVAAGTATITATSEGKSGALKVTVQAPVVTMPPPSFNGDVVVYPNDAIAFIAGPALRLGSSLNPYSWYDKTARERGPVHAAEALNPATSYNQLDGYVVYYDLGLTLYQLYYRTGDEQIHDLARKVVDQWVARLLEQKGAKPYNVAPRSVNLAGIMLRAMDGRPELWDYALGYTRAKYPEWLGLRLNNPKLYYGIRDGGFMLIYAAQLAAAHPDPAVRAEMRQNALNAANQYHARLQSPDGGWYYKVADRDELVSQPFQVGLLMEGLIATHRLTGDATVARTIIKGADWLYQHGFDANEPYKAMWYFVDEQHKGTGHSEKSVIWDARELNGTTIHSFGYAYKLTGDPKYKRQGDEILEATFNYDPSNPKGSTGLAAFRGKEYNQNYRNSGHYLVWRLGR